MKKYIAYFFTFCTVAAYAYYNNRNSQVSSDIVFDPKLPIKEDNFLDGKIVQQQELKIEKKDEDVKKEIQINNSQKDTKITDDKENKKDAEIKKIDPIVNKGEIPKPKQLARNEINKQANEQTDKALKSFFTTVKTSISLNEYDKVEGSVIGFKPMLPYDEKSDTIYGWQTSVAVTDDRYTWNNGLVYRGITSSLDYPLIYGANLFYDIEFPYRHQRASLGLELKSSFIDSNINHYEPITKSLEGRNGIQESVMRGTTVDASVPIPYMPRLKAKAEYFNWSGNDGGSNSIGTTYSLIGKITENLLFTLSQKRERGQEKVFIYNISYIFNDKSIKDIDTPIFTSEAFTKTDIRPRMVEIVERENIIKKQFGGLTVKTR
jgi:hypothetical protein